MFETAGTFTVVELSSSLVALVLLPLVWAAVAAVVALRGTGERVAVVVAIALSGGTFGLAVTHLVRAQLMTGRVAAQHVAQLVRLGQLDLSIDLVRDPTSATLALLVAVLAFASVLHCVWTAGPSVAARLAWMGVTTSATLIVVVADGFIAVAIGLQLATLAAWALARGRGGRPLGLALAGDTAVVFAAWILFWSLGGTFGASGYELDQQPRFAVVAQPAAPRADGKASVALMAYPGALVSSAEGQPLPGEPVRAPFMLTLDPGTYSFQIEAGAATPELLVTHVALAAGRAYVLTPYGPTTSFRNLADQLAVPRPTAAGPMPLRSTLGSRTLAGVRVPTVLGIVVVLAMLLRLALLARNECGGIAFALEAVPPVALVLRVSPLIDPASAAALAIVPAFAAVIFAADAASSRARARTARTALAGLLTVAVAAVLLGEPAAALVLIVASSLGAAGAAAAIESDADVRWLGVACAALSGIAPGVGASSGLAAAVAASFGASAAGRWAGGAVAPLLTIAVILTALSVFRVYAASIRTTPASPRASSASRGLVAVLVVASVVGGAALGVGTSPFGGRFAPLARALVFGGGGRVDVAPRMAVAGLGLTIAAAVIGLAAARRASRSPVHPAWLTVLGLPALLGERVAAAGLSLLRFFVRSVVIMNEDVIDDATEVVAAGVLTVGRGVRRVDAIVARGALGRALGRGADEVVARTNLDNPSRFERVRLGILVGMVAILGLVVLCSVVLG